MCFVIRYGLDRHLLFPNWGSPVRCLFIRRVQHTVVCLYLCAPGNGVFLRVRQSGFCNVSCHIGHLMVMYATFPG